MGNLMTGIEYKLHPDVTPHPRNESQFDPLYGFPNGREPKVMKVTEEEMHSAKIPLDKRDYCAHLLLDFLNCKKKMFPWVYKCHHEKHVYLECEYEEYVDRMKDFEREKRLLHRQKRISAMSAA